MIRAIRWIVAATMAAAGLWLALRIVTYDGLIYFHILFVDYPNPDGHGLKGVTVSAPQILAEALGSLACLHIGYRVLPRRKSSPQGAKVHKDLDRSLSVLAETNPTRSGD